ncbi:MAG: hypothetical protein K6G94_05540 [Kiritimatiellae bacterium]|nr:hypothetical protein [Kiritimatiellia bacterium]
MAHKERKTSLPLRTCPGCGKTFTSPNPNTQFCSLQCAYAHRGDVNRARRYKETVEHIKLCKTKQEFGNKFPSDRIFALQNKVPEYQALRNGKRQKQISDATIIADSKRFHTKQQFRIHSPNMYALARTRGLLSAFSWLTSAPPFHERYVVYRYFFKERNAVYVGLSCVPQRRDRQHRIARGKKTSCVFKFAKINRIGIPEMEVLVSGVSQEEARTKEHEYVNQYKFDGYEVLNTGKTGAAVGSIGGMPKYSKKEFLEVAHKVGDFRRFVTDFKGLYIAALQHGWIKECNFLKRDRRAPKTINDNYAIHEANNKRSIEDLRNDTAVYNYISKNKLWHSTKFGLPRQSLSKEFCISVAKKFSSTSALRKSNNTVYLKLRKTGWIDACPWLSRDEGRRRAAMLKAKRVYQMSMYGKVIKTFSSIAEAARATNVSVGNLTSCLKGRIRSCGGFRWQYAD